VGTLVGQPNKGLQAMFVMMNAARLGVGMQSLGLTEVAYQNAVAYAKDRIQMRALSGPKAPDKPADPIIVHPDVRKMLLTARAYAEGGRALATYTVCSWTRNSSTRRRGAREAADEVALLTPSSRPSSPTTAGSPPRTACRSSAATASSTNGAWSSSCATPHQHDLRRHQHHPVAGPAGPQGAGRQRRHAEEVRQEDRRVRRGRGRQRSDAGVRQPAGRPGRQGHQADQESA
jgi:hypothetical protein